MSSDSSTYRNVLLELLSSEYDRKSTKNQKYAEQLMRVHTQFVERNRKLTELLDDYIKQRRERIKTNNRLKIFIFWYFIIQLTILTCAVVTFIISNRYIRSTPSMVSLLSVSVTYLVSLIAIFEIISKYLFPVDEEKDAINMIQTVINNDIKVEELTSNAIDKNHSGIIEKLKELKQLYDDGILTEGDFTDLKRNLIDKIKAE